MVILPAVTLHSYLYHILDFTVTQVSFPPPAQLAHTGVSDQPEMPYKMVLQVHRLEVPFFFKAFMQ